MTTSLYLYVEDADATVAQALHVGGQLEMEVMDMPWGDRQGGIRDQCHNIGWIAQHL